jgi:pSer/pThr/pTyr-binding forkhead associated (FHA) protein
MGAAVPLPDGGIFRVGREEPADLPLRDSAVSREHALFEFDGRSWCHRSRQRERHVRRGKRVKRRRLKGGELIRFDPA